MKQLYHHVLKDLEQDQKIIFEVSQEHGQEFLHPVHNIPLFDHEDKMVHFC